MWDFNPVELRNPVDVRIRDSDFVANSCRLYSIKAHGTGPEMVESEGMLARLLSPECCASPGTHKVMVVPDML